MELNRVQKATKKPQKRQKRTQYMCGKMLRYIREVMKYEPRDMRASLELTSRRTYEDYESGKRGIPAKLATRIRELFKRDRDFMNGIGARVDAVEKAKKMKMYHGGYGGLKDGSMVLPPSVRGAKTCADYGAGHVCRRDKIYVTTDIDDARSIASQTPNGKVYEVMPIGDISPDPDCLVPGLSFECDRARVVRVVPRRIG